MANNVETLDSITNNNEEKKYKEVSIEDIATKEEKQVAIPQAVQNLLDDIDNAEKTLANQASEIIANINLERAAMREQAEMEEGISSNNAFDSGDEMFDEDLLKEDSQESISVKPSTNKSEEVKTKIVIKEEPKEEVKEEKKVADKEIVKQEDVLNIDEDEFDFTLEDEELELVEGKKKLSDEEKINKYRNGLRESLKDKIKPVMNKIDLGSFTVGSTPTKVYNLFKTKEEKKFNITTWPLFSTGIPVSMEEMTALDITKLNPSGNMSQINRLKYIYAQFHSHIKDANLPDLEPWTKLIHFYDLDHLYFAVFRSCFEGSLIIPYMCDKCNEGFSHTFKDIMDFVKFENDEAKEKFDKIMAQDPTFKMTEIETELFQISDEYVVGLRHPTLFSVIYDTFSLSESFQQKNANFINICTYIDKIYYINKENQTLDPIFCKEYENDVVKSVQYKMQAYKRVLDTLSSDQFNYLQDTINTLSEHEEDVKYRIPECTCPKCGHKIAESEFKGDALLFMRHQLLSVALS